MNEALGRLRRQRPGVDFSSLPEADIIRFPLASTDDPEKSMAQREIREVVERAIDELPEAFRLVFITRVVEGMMSRKPPTSSGLNPKP
jgi:RNA polymerase sigma-70 factor, ECF subfamily